MPIPISKAAEAVSGHFEHLRDVAADVGRTIHVAKRDALEAKDDLVHLIKRDPLKATAFTFGAGAAIGAVLGAIAAWRWSRPARSLE